MFGVPSVEGAFQLAGSDHEFKGQEPGGLLSSLIAPTQIRHIDRGDGACGVPLVGLAIFSPVYRYSHSVEKKQNKVAHCMLCFVASITHLRSRKCFGPFLSSGLGSGVAQGS